MLIKNKDDSFFVFLNYVFKNEKECPKNYTPSLFLLNRWISMANPLYAKIVNLTTNKWMYYVKDFNFKYFYRTVLPQHKNKIFYIKKKEKEKETNDDLNIANIMECSQRELLLFKSTLEELKCANK
jgi:hypothetical protein